MAKFRDVSPRKIANEPQKAVVITNDKGYDYISPGVALVVGASETEIGRALKVTEHWSPGKSAWGRPHTSTNPRALIRTPVGRYNISAGAARNMGGMLKYGGRGLGGVGLVMTYYQWKADEISDTEAIIDGAMGIIGFVPGWGWAVSGAYFLIVKPAYNLYKEY